MGPKKTTLSANFKLSNTKRMNNKGQLVSNLLTFAPTNQKTVSIAYVNEFYKKYIAGGGDASKLLIRGMLLDVDEQIKSRIVKQIAHVDNNLKFALDDYYNSYLTNPRNKNGDNIEKSICFYI
jgi:hypothetical protein